MSLKPSRLTPGEKVLVTSSLGNGEMAAIFIRRIPAKGKGLPAKNFLKFPAFVGLDGPDDDGICEMSDYDLSRRGRINP